MKRARASRPTQTKPKPEVEEEVKLWGADDTEYITEKPTLSVYANNARLNFNNWDANILFGEILGDTGEKLVVLPKVRVTMSLQFIKELRDLLDRNIVAFEEKVGPIQRISVDVE